MSAIPHGAVKIISVAVLAAFSAPAPAWVQGAVSATTAPAPAAKQPKISVKCLPPGGAGAGTACTSVLPGSMLRLDTGTGGAEPPKIYLVEAAGGRSTPVSAQRTAARQGSYRVTVPRDICPIGVKGQQLQFEIQSFAADPDRAENPPRPTFPSVGRIAIHC